MEELDVVNAMNLCRGFMYMYQVEFFAMIGLIGLTHMFSLWGRAGTALRIWIVLASLGMMLVFLNSLMGVFIASYSIVNQ